LKAPKVQLSLERLVFGLIEVTGYDSLGKETYLVDFEPVSIRKPGYYGIEKFRL
jgi:hypothetical protein